MSDAVSSDAAGSAAGQAQATPGTLLRQAREAKRMHIGVLAATLKVPVHRLEALEADRYDDLLDATFTRSLAHSVCRVLKVDPKPVLLGLPRPESVVSSLAELHEVQGQRSGGQRMRVEAPGESGRGLRVAAVLLLIVAAVVMLGPTAKTWLGQHWPLTSQPEALPAGVPAPQAEQPSPGSSSAAIPESAGNTATPAAPNQALGDPVNLAPQLEAKGESWVEIKDGQGTVTWSGTVVNGQTLALEGNAPWSLIIGNVNAVTLRHKGLEVNLEPHTKANVARLTLNP